MTWIKADWFRSKAQLRFRNKNDLESSKIRDSDIFRHEDDFVCAPFELG